MSNVQKKKPGRTCTATYSSYSSFRPYLEADFNYRCGYCDDPNTHYGLPLGFHIDHFKPKRKFPDLETDYSNLVYSCSYCNRAKSDRWQNKSGFVDPCSNDYEKHLKRDDKGEIKSKTPRGEYIVKNLKLYFRRHEFIWNLVALEEQKQQLCAIQTNDANELKVLRQFQEIQKKIDNYNHDLRSV